MDLFNFKHLRFFGMQLNSIACKCLLLLAILVILRALLLPSAPIQHSFLFPVKNGTPSVSVFGLNSNKFLEIPQIVWGLNNQKIAFARACLTARMLNRTLLMPSLSASLFYKELDLLEPISFDKVFRVDKFNSLCKGFVQLGRFSDVSNVTDVFELQKGSGRRWTVEKDLDQLREFTGNPYSEHEIIKIAGKNPFLWHDHWPAKDYAKIFECLVLVEDISKEADKVVNRIREIGLEERRRAGMAQNVALESVPFVAVHMRIEKDWMIHCQKWEQRLNSTEICSSKEQIMQRVGKIAGLETPTVMYLAVADGLLEDNSILTGWKEGLLPFEKKKLGVFDMYKKHSYLIRSAIDYEVCLRSNVFVGNSFSTFSGLVVLERTQKMMASAGTEICGINARWPSYAYNLEGESKGPRAWASNMSDSSLVAISYGTNHVSCDRFQFA